MLCTWGRWTPCGLQWCSNDATTHCCGPAGPNRVLPVMLDVGTDRQSLLEDPLYIGNRHPRVPVAEYDAFLDAFVTAVRDLFPAALWRRRVAGAVVAERHEYGDPAGRIRLRRGIAAWWPGPGR